MFIVVDNGGHDVDCDGVGVGGDDDDDVGNCNGGIDALK